ncbi:MAG: nucleoside triphosphate pyrophosphatase [Candidatus Binatia bacterium]
MRLVLASASPRRAALLGELGVPFAVQPSDVPEMPEPGEAAAAFALRAARDKAAAVARIDPSAWVLGADTVVTVDGEIFGKPQDEADAQRMLRRLSGHAHEVVTAVVLFAPGSEFVEECAVRTGVEFRELGANEIAAYVASGEPTDKAGAYAIQGGAAGFVRRVTGSHTNVIGFPMDEVRAMLDRHGLRAPAVAESR